jgi:hypothetical protein
VEDNSATTKNESEETVAKTVDADNTKKDEEENKPENTTETKVEESKPVESTEPKPAESERQIKVSGSVEPAVSEPSVTVNDKRDEVTSVDEVKE